MSAEPTTRPPLPPFTRDTATQKIRMAEDGWNSRDPQRVSLVYTPDSVWRMARRLRCWLRRPRWR